MDVVSDPTPNNSAPSIPTVTSPLVKPLPNLNEKIENKEMKKNNKLMFGGIALVVILLGVGTGYMVSRNGETSTSTGKKGGSLAMVESKGKEVSEEGIKDDTLFPDKAEGEIQVNDGSHTKEGSHILVRPGGVDQTAYLTSSVVDLDKFVGKKVEIYGQTNTAEKAGWLLDVGYARVIN